MAHERGSYVLLQLDVSSGSPGSFVTLPGQQDTRATGTTTDIDTGDKQDQDWVVRIATIKDLQVTVSGVVEHPDTTGWDLFRTKFIAGSTATCRLLVNADGDYWEADFVIGNFNEGGTREGAIEYTLTLNLGGVPVFVTV